MGERGMGEREGKGWERGEREGWEGEREREIVYL